MSFLTNPYVVIPTIGLSVQIIVLALLLYGYWLNRKLMFPRHGRVMAIAVVLHLVVVFAVMIPSFVLAVVPEYVFTHVSGIVSIVSLIHVPLGTLAILLGVWLVISWRSQGLKGCFDRKKIMYPTMIVWFASLLFGITLYAIFYWSLLMT